MNTKEIFNSLKSGGISPLEAEKKLLELIGNKTSQTISQPQNLILKEEPGQTGQDTDNWDDNLKKILKNPADNPVVDIKELEPGIVQLTMNDRNSKNTFSLELIMGLTKAFEKIEADPKNKVIILTGYDSYFCCGGNKDGLSVIHEGKVKLTEVNVYRLPLDCKLPVIAAMQGHGIGSGLCLGLFSDFIFMSRESTYTCNHMKMGFTPADGATLILPEKLGKNIATEMLFTGNRMRGSELEARGITIPILKRNEILPAALKLAQDLAGAPREALTLLKEHMVASLREKTSDFVDKEWAMQEKTFVSKPEVMEKLMATFDQSSNKASNANSKNAFLRATEIKEKNDAKLNNIDITSPSASLKKPLEYPELIKLNHVSGGFPIFWFHNEGGGVEAYQGVAQNTNRPFYGIQARGRMSKEQPLNGVDQLVSYYTQIIKSVQPEGSYDFGGFSFGGILAYEVTRNLQMQGDKVNSIVMIDSLDSSIKQKTSIKQTMLQTVNLSLVYRIRQETRKVLKVLIRPSDINQNLDDYSYLKQLIELGKQRGLSSTKSTDQLFYMFKQMLKVQEAFGISDYQINSMPNPHNVQCHYLLNKSGSYHGKFEPYLILDNRNRTKKGASYWKEWENNIPNFVLHDINSANHITMMLDKKPLEQIISICKEIYD
jgi:enoyl-CoA hydratase/carnithine racemase/thioesterase domain-containing protein